MFLSALFACCGKDDNASLRKEIDDQDARIEALASEVAEIRQIVQALASGDYVTGVDPIVESGVTTGLTISFHSSQSVRILFTGTGSANGISSASLEDSVLVITLSSGEELRLPVTTVPVLSIARDTVFALPGATESLSYTISGGDSGNSITLFMEGSWTARHVQADAKSGKITLTAPNPCTDAKLVVVVASSAGLSSFRTVICRKEVQQEVIDTFVWEPVSKAADIAAGNCILAFFRDSDSKRLFLSSADELNTNPPAVDADAAEIVFQGNNITAVNKSYVWTVSASGSYWQFAGNDGLYLIACNKYQGVAVWKNLNARYYTTNTYARTWYFTDDTSKGMQMMVSESSTRQLTIPDSENVWSMLPANEKTGHIILYYKKQI